MQAKYGKFGVWLSENEMHIIKEALEWFENTSHAFDKTSKIGSIKNLRNDLNKISEKGVQIPKKVEIPNEDEVFNVQCKECD